MEKKNTFTVINDEGREITCEVLFTFESDETNKNYIVLPHNLIYNTKIFSFLINLLSFNTY